MKVNNFFKTALIAGLIAALSFSVSGRGQQSNPVQLLQQVATEMTRTLDQHKGHLKQNMPYLENVIRQKIVPHFTVSTMARSVVGRDAWKKATPTQRDQFKKEFSEMVIGIYAAPLADYNGDRMEFRPIRKDLKNLSRVQVESVIVRKSGQRIPVNYRMVKIGGDWKVYDFSIEGISMIQSYRSQFSSVLRQQGFSGLLQKVRSHNRNIS